jgi:pimeloyl-ACP methyl ester carboxylesterase
MTKNRHSSSSAIQPVPPQIQTTSISVAGMSVGYFAVGSGEPILFLHSTGSSSRQWYPFAEMLRGRFQAVAPDLCGYGGTSRWPGTERFGLANEVALVTALIDRLGKPMHLVGHSYGGAVALQIARRCPECLSSLTLIEPAAFHLLIDGDNADELAFDEIMDIAATIARAVNCGDYVKAMRRFVDYWSGEGSWAALSSRQRAALAASINKLTLEAWATLNEPTRLEDFVEIELPTLVLCGGRSPLPARRICSHLGRTLPKAELRTIDGAGHMMPTTHVAEVCSLMAAHIEGCRVAA